MSFTTTNDWSYLHLKLINDEQSDLVTWRLLINQAMSRFLGVNGEAIHVDILKHEANEAYIRVPENRASQVWSALSGASLTSSNGPVGIRVVKTSQSLLAL